MEPKEVFLMIFQYFNWHESRTSKYLAGPAAYEKQSQHFRSMATYLNYEESRLEAYLKLLRGMGRRGMGTEGTMEMFTVKLRLRVTG